MCLNPYPTRALEQHSGFEWAQELLAHLHAVVRIVFTRHGTGQGDAFQFSFNLAMNTRSDGLF